jgi:hypothetical protein
MIEWLQGKKTYIVVIIGVVITLLKSFGVIPEAEIDNIWEVIEQLALWLGIGALRAGVAKS